MYTDGTGMVIRGLTSPWTYRTDVESADEEQDAFLSGSIYDRIVTLSKERGIAITALEASCGISRSGISKWKTHSPTVVSLQKVANALGVSITELLQT